MPGHVRVEALVAVGEQAPVLGGDVRRRGGHAERLEHPPADQLRERKAGAELERVPERVVADVRVPEPGPRLPFGLGVRELGDVGRRRRPGLGADRQSRPVHQEVAQRDRPMPSLTRNHGTCHELVVERERALALQLERADRGERLGDGADLEQVVGPERRPCQVSVAHREK